MNRKYVTRTPHLAIESTNLRDLQVAIMLSQRVIYLFIELYDAKFGVHLVKCRVSRAAAAHLLRQRLVSYNVGGKCLNLVLVDDDSKKRIKPAHDYFVRRQADRPRKEG